MSNADVSSKINELVDELEHLRTVLKEKNLSSSEQNPNQFRSPAPLQLQQQQQQTSLASTSSSPASSVAAITNEQQVQRPHEADSPATAVNNSSLLARSLPELAQISASLTSSETAPRYLEHVALNGGQINELFAMYVFPYCMSVMITNDLEAFSNVTTTSLRFLILQQNRTCATRGRLRFIGQLLSLQHADTTKTFLCWEIWFPLSQIWYGAPQYRCHYRCTRHRRYFYSPPGILRQILNGKTLHCYT